MVTESLNPVIDEIVESSTTAETMGETESSQETDGDILEETEVETEVELSEEENDDYDSSGEKPPVEKRISQLVAQKKEAERALQERTEQLQTYLAEAHSVPQKPVREDYSSDDSYDGALMNYKMALAKSDDANKRAADFVKKTLSERLTGLFTKSPELLQNLNGMPRELFETLAISKNPEAIVMAIGDESVRSKLAKLPPHLLGAAIARLDFANAKKSANESAKKAVQKKPEYQPVSTPAQNSTTNRGGRMSMEQRVAMHKNRR
jgi:hypothetical protein